MCFLNVDFNDSSDQTMNGWVSQKGDRLAGRLRLKSKQKHVPFLRSMYVRNYIRTKITDLMPVLIVMSPADTMLKKKNAQKEMIIVNSRKILYLLLLGDQWSGWPEIYSYSTHTAKNKSREIIKFRVSQKTHTVLSRNTVQEIFLMFRTRKKKL